MSDTQEVVEMILTAYNNKKNETPAAAAENTMRDLVYAARAMKAVDFCHAGILRSVLGVELEENP